MKQFISLLLILTLGLMSTKAQTKVENPSSTDNQSVKKRAIKTGFLDPLGNKLSVGYEQWIKKGITLEAKIGLIGVGFNTSESSNPKGAFVKLGTKFLVGKDFYIPGMTYVHPLRGAYFKPEIAISSFKRNKTVGVPSNEQVTSSALLLNFGKQWVLADVFSVDIFGGLGYGLVNTDIDARESNQFSHTQGTRDFPIATSTGISIGLLF